LHFAMRHAAQRQASSNTAAPDTASSIIRFRITALRATAGAGAFCIAKRHRAHRWHLFRSVERLMLAGRKSTIVLIGIC
jgi:hypothetical protein